MNNKTRNSSIELLRIITMMGIVLEHYNSGAMGKALLYADPNSLNRWILLVINSVFAGSVNLFILISGYYLVLVKERSVLKPLKLITQVIVFNEMMYFIYVLMGDREFSIRTLCGNLLPINYFVILYSALYFISPYINLVIIKLTDDSKKTLVMILFVIFSVEPTAADILNAVLGHEITGLSTVSAFGSQSGYTIVNFMLMYIIGAYIRLSDVTASMRKLVLALISIITAITFLSHMNGGIGSVAWSYCSPFVVIEAVVAFLIFLQLKFYNKYINSLAQAAFTVFLFHGLFISYLDIETAVHSPSIVMTGYITGTCMLIYLLCYCAYQIYNFVSVPVFRFADRMIGFSRMVVSIRENSE